MGSSGLHQAGISSSSPSPPAPPAPPAPAGGAAAAVPSNYLIPIFATTFTIQNLPIFNIHKMP